MGVYWTNIRKLTADITVHSGVSAPSGEWLFTYKTHSKGRSTGPMCARRLSCNRIEQSMQFQQENPFVRCCQRPWKRLVYGSSEVIATPDGSRSRRVLMRIGSLRDAREVRLRQRGQEELGSVHAHPVEADRGTSTNQMNAFATAPNGATGRRARVDPRRFETLSRRVGTATSRRAAVTALVGALLAPSGLGLGREEASAGIPIVHCKPPGKHCSGNGRSKKCCSGHCDKGTCSCSKKGQKCWQPLERALCCSQKCKKGKCQ